MVREISECSVIQRLDKEAKIEMDRFSQREFEIENSLPNIQAYIYTNIKTESEMGVSSPSLYIPDLGGELSSLI